MSDTIPGMRNRCWAVLLFVGLTSTVSAALTPFTTGLGDNVFFRTFEDDSGGFYLVWTDAKPDKSTVLLAQHLSLHGEPLWRSGGQVVSSQISSLQDWSGLADGQGGLTLFWDERDGVHAQRFMPDGTRRRSGNSVRMSSTTAIQPDAVPDAEGGTLIVWREDLPIGRSVLLAQRRDSDGKSVWPRAGMRVSLRASSQTNPRAVYDNVSGMIIAWRDEMNNASELRLQRIDFQGNLLWGPEGIKVMAPLGLSEFPQIAPLGTGEVVVAWTASLSQTNQIFLQKAGPEATLKWGTMKLASRIPIEYNRWNPVVLGDDGGGAWIAWEDYRNQVNYQLQINHLKGNGRSAWQNGEIAVGPAAGDQGKAAMIHDGQDGVWIAWIDNRMATIGLYIQEVDKLGDLLQGATGRLVSAQLRKPSAPQIVPLGAGRAAVAWVDRPKKGQWELYWSVVETPR